MLGFHWTKSESVWKLTTENSPSIIFIDEIDAIATKRFDAQTGADREVQRILLELLNQMDGFDQSVNVKVIMATNRQDTLDPALLRPGRLDRKIEFPLPDRRQKVWMIFRVIHGDHMSHTEWLIARDLYYIQVKVRNPFEIEAIFRVGFYLLLFSAELQTEPLATSCYFIRYYIGFILDLV